MMPPAYLCHREEDLHFDCVSFQEVREHNQVEVLASEIVRTARDCPEYSKKPPAYRSKVV
jgi:hypothetical protein